MNMDELTHDYMALRRERERLAAEFKNADENLKEAQSAIEAQLLALCSEHNVDSVRTKNGTVMRSIKSRVHVLDWDAFYEDKRYFFFPVFNVTGASYNPTCHFQGYATGNVTFLASPTQAHDPGWKETWVTLEDMSAQCMYIPSATVISGPIYWDDPDW
jgi:hypothetical protein